MNFITAEQFLNQSEKVQRELIEWWKVQIGDIYCNLYNGQQNNVLVINNCQFYFKSFKNDIKKYGVPLLQMHQLIQFIEDRTGKVIRMDMWEYKNKIMTEIEIPAFDIFHKETSPLEALWQVAIKLIEDN